MAVKDFSNKEELSIRRGFGYRIKSALVSKNCFTFLSKLGFFVAPGKVFMIREPARVVQTGNYSIKTP
jgi:hypothetical protein